MPYRTDIKFPITRKKIMKEFSDTPFSHCLRAIWQEQIAGGNTLRIQIVNSRSSVHCWQKHVVLLCAKSTST